MTHQGLLIAMKQHSFSIPKAIQYYLAKRSIKTVYQKVNVNDKECFTVLITGSASGSVAPPIVVLKQKS